MEDREKTQEKSIRLDDLAEEILSEGILRGLDQCLILRISTGKGTHDGSGSNFNLEIKIPAKLILAFALLAYYFPIS